MLDNLVKHAMDQMHCIETLINNNKLTTIRALRHSTSGMATVGADRIYMSYPAGGVMVVYQQKKEKTSTINTDVVYETRCIAKLNEKKESELIRLNQYLEKTLDDIRSEKSSLELQELQHIFHMYLHELSDADTGSNIVSRACDVLSIINDPDRTFSFDKNTVLEKANAIKEIGLTPTGIHLDLKRAYEIDYALKIISVEKCTAIDSENQPQPSTFDI